MTQNIFVQLEEAKARLAQLRPLSERALRKLEEWYDINFTYTSNALEGNTLTRNETAIVIEKGITVRGKPLKDHNEAVDHYDAVQFMRALAADDRPLSEIDIKQLHHMTVAKTLTTAGTYTSGERFVYTSSGTHAFPPAAAVPGLMQKFVDDLPQEMTPRAAFMAHLEFVSIHPFDDGNGRTARLLMNTLLLRAGCVPLMIDPEDRPDYIDTIETYQTTGDAEPFLELLASKLIVMIENHITRVQNGNGTSNNAKPEDPEP